MLPALPPLTRRPASTGWIVTLADLIALLLSFFVLLYSISTPKTDRLRAIADGLVGRVATEKRQPAGTPIDANVGLAAGEEGRSPAYLLSVMRQALAADPLFAHASVGERGGDVVVTVPLGEAGLPDRAALSRLAPMMERLKNRVSLVVSTGAGPDGWRQSLDDAGRLARALGDAGFAGTVPLLGARLTDGAPRFEIVIADRDGGHG